MWLEPSGDKAFYELEKSTYSQRFGSKSEMRAKIAGVFAAVDTGAVAIVVAVAPPPPHQHFNICLLGI
jgi:hypothetical protein